MHYGKMFKPLEYKSNKKHFGFTWGVHDFYFDAVLSTAFTDGKDDAQFFVNYDNKEEIISLDDKEYLAWFKYDATPRIIKGGKIIVPPLSAIAIKIN